MEKKYLLVILISTELIIYTIHRIIPFIIAFFILFSAILKADDLTPTLEESKSISDLLINKNDPLKKKFNFTLCNGETEACLLLETFFVEYEMNGSSLKIINHNFLDNSIIVKVTPKKQFYKNNGKFSEIISVKLNDGHILQLSFKGLIEENNFFMNSYSFKFNAKELSSGVLIN